jgi:hydrogenase maturation protein HypF
MKRLHLHLTGIVQGVGFRPFVYNLAKKLGLKGWVLNSSEGVHIEVEGSSDKLHQFLELLQKEKPPRAEIKSIKVEELPFKGYSNFEIRESKKSSEEFVLVSPDIATCKECLKELFDPRDRRYRYPFINCTNCGPRFTIIEDIPYDRPKTTMKKFKMCPQCQQEYDDPTNRRFHAQPNACPICGPQIVFLARTEIFEVLGIKGKSLQEANEKFLQDYEIERRNDFCYLTEEEALKAAKLLLKKGMILALKGLGGFHLACKAKDIQPVEKLRQRKRRPSKAFAVMFESIEEAKKAVVLSPEAEKLLDSPQAPIVLLPKRKPEYLAENIAPGLADYGIMLPSTPLHHLLLREMKEPLVMTSGNLSEEPIARDNEEAIERLGAIADGFLIHNRPIHSRYDDSVINAVAKPFMIRRARSYAPYPLDFPFSNLPSIFAAGAELKSTFTLTRKNFAFVSQHLGDLEDELTFNVYRETFELFQKLFRIQPEIITCDLHPDYLSTRFAEEIAQEKHLYRVQHHFAHIASVVGEHNLKEPILGFAFDGTGYGPDGTVWGGEIIVADGSEYQRIGRLYPFFLPTGEAAIKKPYRVAASILKEIDDELSATVAGPEYEVLERLLQSRRNLFLTSSVGRLYDAVAVILGLGREATYEGELAMRLEALPGRIKAQKCLEVGNYKFGLLQNVDDLIELDWRPVVEEIVRDVKNNIDRAIIACKFHNSLAKAILDCAEYFAQKTGIKNLAFSGGVFQNALLNELILLTFSNRNFNLFFHKHLPPNDGCISFGQAVFTAKTLLK